MKRRLTQAFCLIFCALILCSCGKTENITELPKLPDNMHNVPEAYADRGLEAAIELFTRRENELCQRIEAKTGKALPVRPRFAEGIASALNSLPTVDAVEVGSCEGCIYSHRKRPQKCSCCRRNRDLKDCYERREENAAD